MAKKIRLQNLKKTLIIAEAGSNFRIADDPKKNYRHALKLIDLAAKAGADAIKFQLFRAKLLYAKNAGYADYLGKKKFIYDIIQDNELPFSWIPLLKERCDQHGIIFLCTPFDEEAVDFLEKIRMPLYKIASYTVNHLALIRKIAATQKPLVFSTGASALEDIRKVIRTVRREGNNNIAILQCTAKYPAPLSAIHLKTLTQFQKIFPYPVGLSDHSRDPLVAPLGAVALGAKIIEKHFTTDNCLPGPDHAFSVTVEELARMVGHIRAMEDALGVSQKKVLREERELFRFCRRRIFATQNIAKGERVTRHNCAALRPGKVNRGIDAQYIHRIYGKRAQCVIRKDSAIRESDLL